jgi:hypothetical protein
VARIITLGMLMNRLQTIYRRTDEDGDLPLKLSLRGGSGQVKQMDIDCTTRHLQIDDDGTVIVHVAGGLNDSLSPGETFHEGF